MMCKKEPDTFDGSECSVWQIVESANAYYELSNVFIAKLPKSIHEPKVFSPVNGMASASATNRVLALELYLKALLIVTGTLVPKDHNLTLLFDTLPEVLRKTIKTNYNTRNRTLASAELGRPWEIFVAFTSEPELDHEAFDKLRKRVRTDSSLSGLLVRNRKGFVVSRYLFQEFKKGEPSSYQYEHRRLGIICGVLCELLEQSQQQVPQPGYKRSFEF